MITNIPEQMGRPRETVFSVEEWTKHIEFENNALRRELSHTSSNQSFLRGLAWVLFIITCLFCYSSCSKNQKTVEIMEGDAKTLHITVDHWWNHDEYILEARPNPDENNMIQWAKKLPDGTWFFVNAESLYRP